jgi:hypothetical protein
LIAVTPEHSARGYRALGMKHPVAGGAKNLTSYIADKALVFDD